MSGVWYLRGEAMIEGPARACDIRDLGRVEHHGDFVSISWDRLTKRYAIRRSQFHPRGKMEWTRLSLKSARELATAVMEDCKGLAL